MKKLLLYFVFIPIFIANSWAGQNEHFLNAKVHKDADETVLLATLFGTSNTGSHGVRLVTIDGKGNVSLAVIGKIESGADPRVGTLGGFSFGRPTLEDTDPKVRYPFGNVKLLPGERAISAEIFGVFSDHSAYGVRLITLDQAGTVRLAVLGKLQQEGYSTGFVETDPNFRHTFGTFNLKSGEKILSAQVYGTPSKFKAYGVRILTVDNEGIVNLTLVGAIEQSGDWWSGQRSGFVPSIPDKIVESDSKARHPIGKLSFEKGEEPISIGAELFDYKIAILSADGKISVAEPSTKIRFSKNDIEKADLVEFSRVHVGLVTKEQNSCTIALEKSAFGRRKSSSFEF